jgi:hypothetical protein
VEVILNKNKVMFLPNVSSIFKQIIPKILDRIVYVSGSEDIFLMSRVTTPWNADLLKDAMVTQLVNSPLDYCKHKSSVTILTSVSLCTLSRIS